MRLLYHIGYTFFSSCGNHLTRLYSITKSVNLFHPCKDFCYYWMEAISKNNAMGKYQAQ